MPFATREQVAAALFSVVDVALGAVIGLKTSERRIKMPADVSPDKTPALYQLQKSEDYEYTGDIVGISPHRTMHFDLWVYTADAANTVNGVTALPSTQLNTIVQAVEVAFTPDPMTNFFTLGGLVKSCRIQGKLDYLETRVKDGMSLVGIPVSVILP